jgi:FkbM family methyltransferase
MEKLKKIINLILKKFNLKLIKYSNYKNLLINETKAFDLKFINLIKKKHIIKAVKLFPHSRSQLRQDIFVLIETNFKKGGLFIEFGAANGVSNSNTFLLEKKFNWKGILVEPAKSFYKELKRKRNCYIENKIVYKDSKSKLIFYESYNPELSTINLSNNHNRDFVRSKYELETISLNDLLRKYNMPKIIDYLSIDTEGSEFDILNKFNFKEFKFRIITCEHNFGFNRKKVFNLLSKNNYTRKFSEISLFDDWYINKNII